MGKHAACISVTFFAHHVFNASADNPDHRKIADTTISSAPVKPARQDRVHTFEVGGRRVKRDQPTPPSPTPVTPASLLATHDGSQAPHGTATLTVSNNWKTNRRHSYEVHAHLLGHARKHTLHGARSLKASQSWTVYFPCLIHGDPEQTRVKKTLYFGQGQKKKKRN